MIDGIDFLQLLWFLLIDLLFMIFYFTEGFDYGVGVVARFLARNDQGKHLMMETIGLHRDGSEVWLITAGGTMFVSFSNWYASLFSGYYILLFFTLFALIIRGISFEFSTHAKTEHGFRIWTGALFWGSLLAPFFLTMVFGSLVQGVPIDAQRNVSLSFWNTVNPLSVATDVAGILLCLIHGVSFLRLRIDGPELSEWAASLNEKLYLIAHLSGVVFALLVFFQTSFSELRPVSPTAIALIVVALTVWPGISLIRNRQVTAFVTNGLTLVTVVGLLFNGLFPRVLITTDLTHSLLTRATANSKLTLEVVTIVALILSLIALVYII